MNLFLNVVGIVLLVPSVMGIAFGAYMATHPNTRTSGVLFALVWLPLAATAAGILLRDPVTVIVGFVCFLVAGAALLLSGIRGGKNVRGDRRKSSREGNDTPSARTTRENRRKKGYREAAS